MVRGDSEVEAMYEPHTHSHSHHRSKRGNANLASCIVATIFLLLIAFGVAIVYFLVFKPKNPKIAVDSVQFPTFSISNGTVNFTFFQFVSVTNPNRDAFTHYDSSLQLAYSNAPVGFIFIPAGKIDGGHTQHMSAKFAVESFPIPARPPPVTAEAIGGGSELGMEGATMEIETRMKLVGRVRVLKIFTHRVESGVNCGVVIEVRSGSVLGLHC
ncbi:unnamed protein product [Lactuca virosa]|uniref:Late embryogenesis abundant protein LEA-2 subgroup domain-containing protein n=1 Tax=Lactuca virosa TaxID=75947 RepID=A0AAU9LQ01_9ASTR|nr:unnamed protein product [Lactuca virosa]